MKEVFGNLDAKGKKFAIIAARFNSFISERLIEGAVDCLIRHGCNEDDVTIIRVPGSFEITPTAKKVSDSGKYDAAICIGALIRGATPHFEYVARSVTSGLTNIAAEGKIALTFGILTTDTIEQSIERAGTKSGNKGFDAALSAIEMVNLYKVIEEN
ncbi:MAG: 6,7-dimethyl-8-ribityllumazine synthase [Spirochaetes bacterium]|nr:6,7-dimethyl-8-ribityllumazine synthase [Spirochaetota bacterium]MCK5266893.1 6,7-dimethyl-8-ribityllumazine synthase [Spirochaetota bacterium]